jgi:hypothetical protein
MCQTQNSGQNPEISEGHCDVSEYLKKNSTHQSFPWVVSQLFKKFPLSCLTGKFIPVFTKLSRSQPSHLINIATFHQGILSDLFSSGFSHRNAARVCLVSLRATCFTNLILLYLI